MESVIATSSLDLNDKGTTAPALSQKFEDSDWNEDEE